MPDIPVKAKKPKDHQTPQGSLRTVTVADRDWTVDPAFMDDFEFPILLGLVDEDPSLIGPVLMKVLGKGQLFDALKLLRDKETGRVDPAAGEEFMTAILKGLDPNS